MHPYEQGHNVAFEAAGLTKDAGLGDMVTSGAKRLGQSFKALWNMPKSIGNRMEAGRMARGLEREADKAVPGQQLDLFEPVTKDPAELRQRAQTGRQWANKELTHQAWQAAPAVATLGAGGMGVSYATGPADTTGNRVRRTSNQYLGTNFGQQSRFDATFGR